MNFARGFKNVEALKLDPLFQKMLPDMTKGNDSVFPAVRDQYMSFYYKGGGLFEYRKEFTTHYKYAFVPKEKKPEYVTEKTVQNMHVTSSFLHSYDDIKERCEKYGTTEADCVSALYKYSAASGKNIILLDTEIALYNEEKDRIDLLLYDTEKHKLLFCEAKHFSNPELWAKEGCKPKVVDQIQRYNKKVSEYRDVILEQYSNCIDVLNQLFGTAYDLPSDICPNVGLLIFGYDFDQKEKIKRLLVEDGSLDGISHYQIGDMKGVNINNIFNALEN